MLATEPSDQPTLADRLQDDPPARRETIEILRRGRRRPRRRRRCGHRRPRAEPVVDHARPRAWSCCWATSGSWSRSPRGCLRGPSPTRATSRPRSPAASPRRAAATSTRSRRVLLECLTGAPPFDGSLQLIAYAHAAEPPPRPSDRDPDLGEGFDAVMEVALSKSPDDRFASARDLIDAAANVLGVAPASAVDLRPMAAPADEVVPRIARARAVAPSALVALPLAAAVATLGFLAGDSGEAPRSTATPAAPSRQLVEGARTIDGTVARLNSARREGRARLASARTPNGQARAADGLARSYLDAAALALVLEGVRDLDSSALSRPMVAASHAYSQTGERGARRQPYGLRDRPPGRGGHRVRAAPRARPPVAGRLDSGRARRRLHPPRQPRPRGAGDPPGAAVGALHDRRGALHRARARAGRLPDVALPELRRRRPRCPAPLAGHDVQGRGRGRAARRRQGRDRHRARASRRRAGAAATPCWTSPTP